MSSLPHLHTYLDHVSTISNGVPLPVTRSLLKTIRTLTKPLYRRSSFRPVDIVTALSSNRRIISREQQDAQEFFQLVSSAMDTEGQKIVKTELLGGGLRDLLSQSSIKGVIRPEWVTHTKGTEKEMMNDHLENPFTGLLDNRIYCMQCGYTGAIRHFTFNNIQLSVPNKVNIIFFIKTS
jgi:ubiquitin carboxyl-terminal hydrolase 1